MTTQMGEVSGNEGRKLGFLCFGGRSLHLLFVLFLGMRKDWEDGWVECIYLEERRLGMSGKFTGYVVM